ncbi:beta-1,3-galactosyl-O-glycosyl-glycoprotein beta-1,6-N-acetylglucosaminyltransferase-like [Tubulanus polymorphus]|uniref:beta-1,3-galactosyl-O-glycosyl-glycoprotein beta-1,6-N-acetylglucosaminyltransferase-like n=1 Tax=Tubulanus polymorphus TaxID=672921 RepID=UPI003DA4CDC2
MYKLRSRVVFVYVSVLVAIYIVLVCTFLLHWDGRNIPWLFSTTKDSGGDIVQKFRRCAHASKLQGVINRTIIEKFVAKRTYAAPYCRELIAAVDATRVIEKARRYATKHAQVTINPSEYGDFIDCFGCDDFRYARAYAERPSSDEEQNFPIAFGITVYKDIEQVERLLRMIYAPQNYYCFHVDKKASADFKAAMKRIVDCFPNAILTSQSFDVKWATITVLDADLQCIKDLLDFNDTWIYYINLTGQEVPLVSNRQLVRILKAMNGSNDIFISKERKRWEKRWAKNKSAVPHQLTLFKGNLHLMAHRNFTEFITRNHVAINLYNWLRGTEVPDETFYSTLSSYQKNVCVPGAHAVDLSSDSLHFRWKVWTSYPGHPPCFGKALRDICIHGIGDIGRMVQQTLNRSVAFMNKMFFDFEYLAFDCMEQYLKNLTNKDHIDNFVYDTKTVDNWSYVRNKRVC